MISNDHLHDNNSTDTGTNKNDSSNNMVQMEGSGQQQPFWRPQSSATSFIFKFDIFVKIILSILILIIPAYKYLIMFNTYHAWLYTT